MTAILRLWRGELPLAAAFWNWAVIGGFAVNAVTSLLFLLLVSMDRPLAALFAGYALSLPYNLLATVGVWRSAAHFDGDPRWADIARIVTVVTMLLLSLT
ncbi:MAG: hypothetical protein PVG24_05715 [Gammaproteobacteria bacterium]|jgi:hypothetical protein